jgi:hypothetical protein
MEDWRKLIKEFEDLRNSWKPALENEVQIDESKVGKFFTDDIEAYKFMLEMGKKKEMSAWIVRDGVEVVAWDKNKIGTSYTYGFDEKYRRFYVERTIEDQTMRLLYANKTLMRGYTSLIGYAYIHTHPITDEFSSEGNENDNKSAQEKVDFAPWFLIPSNPNLNSIAYFFPKIGLTIDKTKHISFGKSQLLSGQYNLRQEAYRLWNQLNHKKK